MVTISGKVFIIIAIKKHLFFFLYQKEIFESRWKIFRRRKIAIVMVCQDITNRKRDQKVSKYVKTFVYKLNSIRLKTLRWRFSKANL